MTDRRPKLLVVTPDFPPARGGIQLLSHRLAATMSRLDPLVVAPGGVRAGEWDRDSDVRVHRIADRFADQRAKVLHLNGAALVVARRFSPDVVLSAHIVATPAAALIKKTLKVPLVQYLHASEIGARPRLAAFALARADATIAVSRHTAALARQAGARAETLHLIPPGVDLPERWPQPRCERPTIITVSRLEERYKGHDTVIRALPLVRARVPDVQWIVIGDGPRRAYLERLAEIYGVSSAVRFLGELDNVDRDRWLERAHIFTMPSRVTRDGQGGEGFGIVYLEAGWHGLPVVAGNAGGSVDAVEDGETGLLVDADDPVAVANALADLLVDDELRLRLGEAGAVRARQFAWPLITQRVEDVLLSVLPRRD